MTIVMVNAHVRAVHQFDHRRIDSRRLDIELLPQLLPFLRRQLERGVRLLRLGKLGHKEIRQVVGDFQIRAASRLDLEFLKRVGRGHRNVIRLVKQVWKI